MLRVANRDRNRIRSQYSMAVEAFFQAVLLGANSIAHRIVTLVHQQRHMVATHEVCILDTSLALPLWDIGVGHITSCNRQPRKAGQRYHSHSNSIAA